MKIAPLLLLLLLSCAGSSFAQTEPAKTAWSPQELQQANTAENAAYLNEEEKNMVFYMNLARTDGEKFFNTFFQDFVNAYNQDMRRYSNYDALRVNRKDKYYRGLQEDLQEIKGLPLFSPDETLTYVARLHGKDLSKHNLAGHKSSDGRTVKDRIGKYYPGRAMAENLAFGFSSGLANVCMLLLDKNVPDLGHRTTILGEDYHLREVGVFITTHPGYKYCAVTDFISAASGR